MFLYVFDMHKVMWVPMAMLCILFLGSLGAESVRVESGYAETLSDDQRLFCAVTYEDAVWEAGYSLRYPANDVTIRATLPLYHHGYFRPAVHVGTRTFEGWNIDAVMTGGQRLSTQDGRWLFSYGLGVQVSWYLHRKMTGCLFTQATDFHLFVERRFRNDRMGVYLAYDSSTFFWYSSYIHSPIITMGTNWNVTPKIDVTLSARCRNSDFWIRNVAITMVEFKAGCRWRLR